MFEVEIKVRIPNPNLIREKFTENNGVYKFSLLHEDTYYNMPIGLRDFKSTDEALRLRKSTKFNKIQDYNNNQKTEYFITYKGRKIDKFTKTRKEIDIRIGEINKMKELLKLLGFQEVLTIIKERELHKFQFKNLQIEALIDYLPALKQHFIEVEHLSESSEQIDDSREVLFDFLSLFGIKREESIRKSYLELIIENYNKV